MSTDVCFEEKLADPEHITSIADLAQASYIGWALSGAAAVIASSIAFHLIFKHLQFYTRPNQQRYIVRIILLIPIYACISWLSYFFYRQSVYFELVRDCYEAFVIASFFILLLQYLGDSVQVQQEKLQDPEREIMRLPLPFCCVRFHPANPHFIWILKYCVLQYVVLRPLMTILAVILQTQNLYCPESMSPSHAHLYITIVLFVSVSVALYALVVLYLVLKDDLTEYEPFSKFLAIKLIIFVSFWQSVVISFLADRGYIKATTYWTKYNISSGLNSFIVCFELILFAIYFSRAFDYRPYRPAGREHVRHVWKGMVDSLNLYDFLKEIWYGIKYLQFWICGPSKVRTVQDDGTIVESVASEPEEPQGRGNYDLEAAIDKVRHGSIRRYRSTMGRNGFQRRRDADAEGFRMLEEGTSMVYGKKEMVPLPDIPAEHLPPSIPSSEQTILSPSPRLDENTSELYAEYWRQNPATPTTVATPPMGSENLSPAIRSRLARDISSRRKQSVDHRPLPPKPAPTQ